MDAPNDMSQKAQELQDKLDKKFDGELPDQMNPSDLNEDQSIQIGKKSSEETMNEDSEDITLEAREDSKEDDLDQDEK